jgi:hypothetical protein
MTGDHYRQLIGSTCPGNGAHGSGFPDGFRHLLITCRFTAGDGAQRLPDLLLESRAANIQR